MEYPKIETLFDRDERFKVIPGKLRLPEFGLVERWLVTEKIDGTNVRVHYRPEAVVSVAFYGRTPDAQMPTFLLSVLQQMFTPAILAETFTDVTEVWLFGEGYGPKIQKGGGNYRKDTTSFRLFDVKVGDWWLNWENVQGVAGKLGVATAPSEGELTFYQAVEMAREGFRSRVAIDDEGDGCQAEGIVCRTEPLLFTRSGQRLMWKLKAKDFA